MKLFKRNDQYSPFPHDAYYQEQLRIGAAIESKEHAVSAVEGRKIAADHIREDLDYYAKLAKLEHGTPMWGWDKIFTF